MRARANLTAPGARVTPSLSVYVAVSVSTLRPSLVVMTTAPRRSICDWFSAISASLARISKSRPARPVTVIRAPTNRDRPDWYVKSLS